jgi:GNAT superfamily N-acetyltransferase
VKRSLAGGYELDDDRGRVDAGVVHRYLAEESYWARGVTLDEVQRRIAVADRVVGVYAPGGALVGFSRTGCVHEMPIAYLFDVFVLAGHRGRGLGVELVRETVDRGPYARHKWLLDTDDAHGLYARFGFTAPDATHLQRARPVTGPT